MVAEVVVLVVAGVALVAAAKTRLTVTAHVPPPLDSSLNTVTLRSM